MKPYITTPRGKILNLEKGLKFSLYIQLTPVFQDALTQPEMLTLSAAQRIAMRNGNVIINGNSVTIRGSGNVAIVNGKIFVNGEDVTPDSKEINIVVEGDVNSLSVDTCSKVSIKGNVGAVDTASGAVEIAGDVSGNVKSVSGSIICQKVGGNIKTTSGNIISR